MSERSSSSSSGIGIFGLLTVVAVCAKVFGFEPVASWSWWWVTCLAWGPLAVLLFVFAIIGLGALTSSIADKWEYRKR